MFKNISDCYQLAAQQCLSGYYIMTANEEIAGITSEMQTSGGVDNYEVNYRRYLIYTCK